MNDPHDEDCPVGVAFRTWLDMVSIQEEHSEESGLSFKESMLTLGWPEEHVECFKMLIDNSTADVIESASNPAEAIVLIRSALCQMSLIAFTLGRQQEGADIEIRR
jgi:hypothetical protein